MPLIVATIPYDICFLVFDYLSVEDLLNIYFAVICGDSGLTSIANLAKSKCLNLINDIIFTEKAPQIDIVIDNERETYRYIKEGQIRFRSGGVGDSRPYMPFKTFADTRPFIREYSSDGQMRFIWNREKSLRPGCWSPASLHTGYGPSEIGHVEIIFRSRESKLTLYYYTPHKPNAILDDIVDGENRRLAIREIHHSILFKQATWGNRGGVGKVTYLPPEWIHEIIEEKPTVYAVFHQEVTPDKERYIAAGRSRGEDWTNAKLKGFQMKFGLVGDAKTFGVAKSRESTSTTLV